MTVPDAPWIRDAEMYGTGSAEPDPICPVCEEECGTIYFDVNMEPCGCDKCITTRDAWDWWQDKLESEYEDEMDRRRLEE